VAVLINRRADREVVSARIGSADVSVDQYATATQALGALVRTRFDLIVMEGKVYPGFGCPDAAIRELAEMLPNNRYSENLLYWQVGLRILETVRSDEGRNRETPVVIRFPELQNYSFAVGDELTRDSVESDLEDKGPVTPCFGVPMAAFAERVAEALAALGSDA
jgi:hypothetical protein